MKKSIYKHAWPYKDDALNLPVADVEIKSTGFTKEFSEIGVEQHGSTIWDGFYLVAPDGLCYCIGQKQE